MPSEIKGVVKAVRSLSLLVARKRHLVATGQAALLKSVLHHGASNPFALLIWTNGYVFDDA